MNKLSRKEAVAMNKTRLHDNLQIISANANRRKSNSLRGI